MNRVLYAVCSTCLFYFFISSKKGVRTIDTLYPSPEDLASTEIARNASELPEEYREEYIDIYAVLNNPPDIPEENFNGLYERIAELDKMRQNYDPSVVTREIEENDVFIESEGGGLRPLNVPFIKNAGYQMKNLTRNELIDYMESLGFNNLDKYSTGMIRRIWLAYSYDQFFWDVHYKTELPISIIYCYFIMEATVQGVESDLMRNYMNPGGVKFRGVGKKAKKYDDCYNKTGQPILCDFAVYETYNDMVNGWSSVFNNERYADCKTYKYAGEICKCLYRSGYHTANNWSRRAAISREYWKLRSTFPN